MKKTGNYYGVSAHPARKQGGKNLWISQLKHNTTTHYMGVYEDEKKAAATYDRKCDELHLRYLKNARPEETLEGNPFEHIFSKPTLYDGVSQNGPNKWRVQFRFKGTNYYLGLHNTLTTAADVYDKKCIQLGLREPRPVSYVELPPDGVAGLAKLMSDYLYKKSTLKKNKKNKYEIERKRKQPNQTALVALT
jgi:hypothetical protein